MFFIRSGVAPLSRMSEPVSRSDGHDDERDIEEQQPDTESGSGSGSGMHPFQPIDANADAVHPSDDTKAVTPNSRRSPCSQLVVDAPLPVVQSLSVPVPAPASIPLGAQPHITSSSLPTFLHSSLSVASSSPSSSSSSAAHDHSQPLTAMDSHTAATKQTLHVTDNNQSLGELKYAWTESNMPRMTSIHARAIQLCSTRSSPLTHSPNTVASTQSAGSVVVQVEAANHADRGLSSASSRSRSHLSSAPSLPHTPSSMSSQSAVPPLPALPPLPPLPSSVPGLLFRTPSFSVSRITSSFRRVPSSASHGLSHLPNDVINHILSFLNALDLTRLAQTNKQMEARTKKDRLWAPLFRRWISTLIPIFPQQQNDMESVMTDSDVENVEEGQAHDQQTDHDDEDDHDHDDDGGDVIERMRRMGCGSSVRQHASASALDISQGGVKQLYLDFRASRVESAREEHVREVQLWKAKKWMCMLHCIDGPVFPVITGVLLLLGLILTVQNLESTHGSDGVDLSALLPYFICIGFVLLVVVCACVARWDRRHRCCHPDAYFDEANEGSGLIRPYMINSLQNHGSQLILSAFMCLCIALFCIFFLLKISNVLDWSYPIIFSPIFLDFFLMACLCFHPIMSQYGFGHRIRTCLTSWCFINGPLAAFFILLCIRLRHGFIGSSSASGLSWMEVMIPLFILNFFVCCLSCIITIDERSAAVFLASILCWGPILAFEVMLAYWLDQGGWIVSTPQFVHVFIPLFIFMSCCLCASLLYCMLTRRQTTRIRILCEKRPPRRVIHI